MGESNDGSTELEVETRNFSTVNGTFGGAKAGCGAEVAVGNRTRFDQSLDVGCVIDAIHDHWSESHGDVTIRIGDGLHRLEEFVHRCRFGECHENETGALWIAQHVAYFDGL